MARAQAYDYLHNMRFQVFSVTSAAGPAPLPTYADVTTQTQSTDTTKAGFSAITTPEVTNEIVTYREGQYLYTRKALGIPSYNDITLSRGVTLRDSAFWKWMQISIVGTQEYRVDMEIRHYHRADTLPGPQTAGKPSETLLLDKGQYRSYSIYNAVPTRQKFAADMDATSSEVSIMELDVAYEHAEVSDSADP